MPKLQWYLIDTERTFCKVWKFIITWLTIYSLFVSPFIMVFECVFSCYICNKCQDPNNETCPETGTLGDETCVDSKN